MERAQERFRPFNNAHEGYAVILEELDELWAAVKQNDLRGARSEAVHVAAMAIRFIVDLQPEEASDDAGR